MPDLHFQIIWSHEDVLTPTEKIEKQAVTAEVLILLLHTSKTKKVHVLKMIVIHTIIETVLFCKNEWVLK